MINSGLGFVIPTLDELAQRAYAFSVPLTHRFRRVDHREGLLIEGPMGWGEFAPFIGYDSKTSARWLAAAIESAYGEWPAIAIPQAAPPVATPHAASAATQRGASDEATQVGAPDEGTPAHREKPQARESAQRVAVNAIIPAIALDDAIALARAAVDDHGCLTIKVKVAEPMQTLDDDIARVLALRRAIGDRIAIRLDANAAWTVEHAVLALPALIDAAQGIEYAEQPCASLDELGQLRQELSRGSGVDVRIAVDEAIRLDADPMDPQLHTRIRDVADVLIVKVAPLGGIAVAARIAEAIGLPVVVSSAMDTSVGLSAGAALAAALAGARNLKTDQQSGSSTSLDQKSGPPTARGLGATETRAGNAADPSPGSSDGISSAVAHGLGSGLLLAADLTRDRVIPYEGHVGVGRVDVDSDLLGAATKRMPPDRITWWHQRLADAYPHLPGVPPR